MNRGFSYTGPRHLMATSTSSLAKYRPAILALTAIAAGCTVFYIQNVYWSSAASLPPAPTQSALHRSNARRRNRQSRNTNEIQSNGDGEQSRLGNPIDPTSDRENRPESGFRPSSSPQPIAVADLPAEVEALEGRETIVDVESEHSWRDEADNDDNNKEGQSLLSLLFRIAEEQARKEGYIHRGVTCNSCNTMPILGIRYRCANCADFDLCEQCEAMQIHPRTHLFYKVRIPAPFLGNPRQPQPVWYPGKPSLISQPLPKSKLVRFLSETAFQTAEIEALWEQFRCLAGTEWVEDPDHYHLAIDRTTFDKCFVPNTTIRPPPPNLIYDRMFSFYDTNHDGLIGFEEFLKGLSSLTKQKWDDRRRRIFDGYDINQDGYVDRKDFLRMFRAFYALSKELTKEIVTAMDEDMYEEGGARDIIMSNQPISSAFSGPIPLGERSRTTEGKRQDEIGDDVVIDDVGTVKESGEDTGDHNEVLADVVEAAAFGSICNERIMDSESMFTQDPLAWPPKYANAADVKAALDRDASLEDINDAGERRKVIRAALRRITTLEEQRRTVRQRGVHKRWQRRQFYLDEEDGASPPDDFKPDETDEIPPALRRSRSSSKVRFQDDLTTDDEHETRSATSMSSRSIPVGERWGGYEVPEAEKDVGREILYQVTQEGLNELLDPIFEQREDLAIMVQRTKRERKNFRSRISAFATEEIRESIKMSMDKFQRAWRRGESPSFPDAEGFIRLFTMVDDDPPAMEFEINMSMNQANNSSDDHSGDQLLYQARSQLSGQETLSQPSRPETLATDPEFPPTTVDHPSPVTTFDDLNQAIEPEISSKSIDELLESASYAISSELTPDPTLPQNRPNGSSVRSIPTSPTLGSSPDSSIPLSPTSNSTSSSVKLNGLGPVSVDRLMFLVALDQIEAEDLERGGPGRLNFEEFDEVLAGSKGGSLSFVGAWIEMAKF